MAHGGRDGKERLALFLPDLGGGGAERVALTLMQGFLERGHEVDLVLGVQKGSLLPLIPAGVNVVDLGSTRLRHALGGLVRYLKRRRPDALHAMMWPAPLLAISARMIARVDTRIVASEHVVLSKTPMGLSSAWLRALTRRLYSRADRLIAVSHGVADDVSAYLGIARDAITVIYNPLTLPADLVDDPAVQSFWPAGTKRLLAVGEMKAEKNFALLLRALALLRHDVAVSLLILGKGSLEEELRGMVCRLGLTDQVVFAGFAEDVWPFFMAADLFVLSSDVEGFGNVLVEAMHAGVPIVSTDCPSGPREVLDHGAFGTLVPCNDAPALARAIRTALDAPRDPRRLRARAQQLSGDHLIDKHLDAMLGGDRDNSRKSE